MRVLVGYSTCPHTRAAFEAKGHEVWTCDLPNFIQQLQHAERQMDEFYRRLRAAGIVVRQGEIEVHSKEQHDTVDQIWKEVTGAT